jgi:hypothetical protein
VVGVGEGRECSFIFIRLFVLYWRAEVEVAVVVTVLVCGFRAVLCCFGVIVIIYTDINNKHFTASTL